MDHTLIQASLNLPVFVKNRVKTIRLDNMGKLVYNYFITSISTDIFPGIVVTENLRIVHEEKAFNIFTFPIRRKNSVLSNV